MTTSVNEDKDRTIIWLASYPRSGNTFLRILIHALAYGDTDDSSDVEDRVPDLHYRTDARQVPGATFIKTHYLARFHRHPWWGKTGGAIYLYRNPIDVAISAMRYLGVNDLFPDERSEFINNFATHCGVRAWSDYGFGTWNQHVTSWALAAQSVPVLFISYEDLTTSTPETLRRIARYLALSTPERRLDEIAARYTRDYCRQWEERERSGAVRDTIWRIGTSARFVSLGLGTVSREVPERFYSTFGNVAAMLGYSEFFEVC